MDSDMECDQSWCGIKTQGKTKDIQGSCHIVVPRLNKSINSLLYYHIQYLASTKGSLTATTSMSSLMVAICRTSLPIRPNPARRTKEYYWYLTIPLFSLDQGLTKYEGSIEQNSS
jgi:hypothetical protein